MKSKKKKWMNDALCRTGDASYLRLFYSFNKRDVVQAKKICSSCPVRIPCYDFAIRNKEPAGIWGGVVFDPAGPIIDKVVIPEATTYIYTPTRIHQPLSFQGQTSELSRSASVDQEPAGESNEAGQAVVWISTQRHAE